MKRHVPIAPQRYPVLVERDEDGVYEEYLEEHGHRPPETEVVGLRYVELAP